MEEEVPKVQAPDCTKEMVSASLTFSISCEGKKIKDAYHILCDACASKDNVCAKCRESRELDDSKQASLEDSPIDDIDE
jgi:hypothetical protein